MSARRKILPSHIRYISCPFCWLEDSVYGEEVVESHYIEDGVCIFRCCTQRPFPCQLGQVWRKLFIEVSHDYYAVIFWNLGEQFNEGVECVALGWLRAFSVGQVYHYDEEVDNRDFQSDPSDPFSGGPMGDAFARCSSRQ